MLGTLLGNPGMSQDASIASTATGSGEVKKEGQYLSYMTEQWEQHHPAKDLEQAAGTGATSLGYEAATGRKSSGRICISIILYSSA